MLISNISMLNYIIICVFDPTSNVLILNHPVHILIYNIMQWGGICASDRYLVCNSRCLPNP